MEMRNKGNAKGGGDKIVRRELASVFTNGTVVDEAFLAGDDASHCVAIKVRDRLALQISIIASNHRISFRRNTLRQTPVHQHTVSASWTLRLANSSSPISRTMRAERS